MENNIPDATSTAAKEDAEIQGLLNSLGNMPEEAPKSAGAIQHILTPQIIADSLGSITAMFARWTDIKEVAFTEDDKKDLANALKPFEDKLDELLKYLPYLPLGMFAVGYGMRVAGGYKDKQKKDKEDKAAQVAKAQAESAQAKKEAEAKAAV